MPKSPTYKRAFIRFMIFGLLGLLFEVTLGAILRLKGGNYNLRGSTSIWMILDYGLLGLVLMPIARPLIKRKIPLPFRAVVYMLGIYLVEFVSGWLFDICSIEIWDYSNYSWNLYGYITLWYLPLWYAIGLVAEYLYRKVDLCAVVLLSGRDAETLLN
ncbi:MAG: hypothetical protein JXD22_13940 [Sedimentisphaerales bacterium]|nr:hypothetical protein [Sedimentisphaerales bacterium]